MVRGLMNCVVNSGERDWILCLLAKWLNGLKSPFCVFLTTGTLVIPLFVESCMAAELTSDSSKEIRQWADIDRWQIEVESELAMYDDANRFPTREFVTHRIFAASSSCLYHFTGHDRDDKIVHVSWLREPFNLETTIRGEKLILNSFFNRSFKSQNFGADAELPLYVARDNLTFVVPVWPIGGIQRPAMKPGVFIVVGDAVQSEIYSRVDEQIAVGSEECYVLEALSGADRILISRDKALCVMQRQIRNPLTGALLFGITTKRIEQVSPGLWMPVEFETSNFDGNAVHGEVKKTDTSVTRVLNWKFNSNVPDERFTPTIRPGSIEVMSDDSFHQVDTAGVEHLDEIAAFFLDQGMPYRHDRTKEHMALEICVFAFAVIGGCLVGPGLLKLVKRAR